MTDYNSMLLFTGNFKYIVKRENQRVIAIMQMVILGKTKFFVVCFSHMQFNTLAQTVTYLSYFHCNIFPY